MALIGKIRKNSWILIVMIGLGLGGFIIMDMTSGQQSVFGSGQFTMGEVEGEKLVSPDPAVFKTILYGVDERFLELETIVIAHFQQDKEGQNKKIEPLLKAVFLCGAYELFVRQDIDSPIIINDYLNVTHAFYEQGEVNLVNGILDAISKIVRD